MKNSSEYKCGRYYSAISVEIQNLTWHGIRIPVQRITSNRVFHATTQERDEK
jgi:hypothetical protein